VRGVDVRKGSRKGHRRTPNILPSNGPDVFQVSSSDGYTAAF
jgi:hypothetical protein